MSPSLTLPEPDAPISAPRKWAITFTVMVVAFMQILDTSVTNVILPHLQGSLSAGLDEVSWVITSYLAANAVIIPATGWLAGLFGRKRFFLISATLFVVSSFLSGAAPDLGHGAHELVAGYARQQLGPAVHVAVHVVQHGEPDPARFHPDQHLAALGGRGRDLLVSQHVSPRVKHLGVHHAGLTRCTSRRCWSPAS